MATPIDTLRARFLTAILWIGACAAPVLAVAADCGHYIISAADGYTNVRSAPRVARNNLVAALPTGAPVEAAAQPVDRDTRRSTWIQVEVPVSGWVHGSQLTAIDCNASPRMPSDAGLAAITRLAARARAGNASAGASFLGLARGVDGALAEAYRDAIGTWATERPATLAVLIKRQPQVIRSAALEQIGIALEGASLETRGRFRIEMIRR